MKRIRISLTLSVVVAVLLSITSLAFAQSSRNDYRLDNEFFRRGLINRGFDDWLEVYDREHPPVSDIDLLAQQIGQAWLHYKRENDSQLRTKNLDELLALELERIELYPNHPLAANWRVRYAGDLLNEKVGPQAFIHLINLSLPKTAASSLLDGLDKIEAQLSCAEDFLLLRNAEFQKLSDAELANMNRQGLPELYQASLYQAKYLRVWSLYHRTKLLALDDPNRSKQLYTLNDLLTDFDLSQVDSELGSCILLRAIVNLDLEKYANAQKDIDRSINTLPGSYLAFAYIQLARLSIAVGDEKAAMRAIKKIQSFNLYRQDLARGDLLNLSLLLLEGRAELAKRSFAGKKRSRREPKNTGRDEIESKARNRIWSKLTTLLIEKSNLRPFVFPQLAEISEDRSFDSLADIELLAHAEMGIANGNNALARSVLQKLIARPACSSALKTSASLRLALSLESQGEIAEALELLQELSSDPNASDDILVETARLAWLAYRENQTASNRGAFVNAAVMLIERCPKRESADQFKLLLADEYSRQRAFDKSLEWIASIRAGSPRYLQSLAHRLLVLTRKYKDKTFVDIKLADKIGNVFEQLMRAVADHQKKAGNSDQVESWAFSDDQLKLVGSAILSAVDVLSNPKLNRGDFVCENLIRYQPILHRYRKFSDSALMIEISSLAQVGSLPASQTAIALSFDLLDQHKLSSDQLAQTIIFVLETAYEIELENRADVLGESGNTSPLAKASFDLARRANRQLTRDDSLSPFLSNQLEMLCVVTAFEVGKINEAVDGLGELQLAGKKESLDLTLIRARLLLMENRPLSAAKISMVLLKQISPQNIRYWHALIINLKSHIAMNSDRTQIISAILARKQEYPNLGSDATKQELEKILNRLQRE